MSPTMYTDIVVVTPHMAKQMLLQNYHSNRNISPSKVKLYTNIIKAGQWQLTHQGLAFASDGQLIDGQHRLLAVIETNTDVPFMITYNVPVETFKCIDNGWNRTISARSGLRPHVASICSMFHMAITPTSTAVQADDVLKIYSVFGEAIDQVYTGVTRARFSVAPIQAAVALHVYEGNDYALEQYRAVLSLDVAKFKPATAGFFKRVSNITITSSPSDRIEGLTRAYKALKRENANLSNTGFKDIGAAIDAMRKRIRKHYFEALTLQEMAK